MNLANLTKQQKLELLQLIEEKSRRLKSSRPQFKPHPGQLRVIQSSALERYLFCGNAFGKSTVLVNELHWAATGYNPIKKESTPVPAKICLLLDDPLKVDDVLNEYRKWNPLSPDQCHQKGKPYTSFITYENGSTVTVLTHAVEPLKLEGSQWTHLFMDEPPPAAVFKAIFRGMRVKGNPAKVLLAGTPITATWLRTEIFEPWTKGELPHVECFRGDSEENADNLEEGYLDRFAQKLSEKEREIRLRGMWFDLDGLALAHLFKRDTHIVRRADYTFNKAHPVVVAVDPHPNKKHVALMLGADDYGYVVLKEMAAKATPRDFARMLKKFYEGYRVLDIVCDSLGSSEMTGGEGFKSFIQVCQDEGVRLRSTTYADKDDEDWINRIQDVLQVPTEPNNFGQCMPKLRVLEGLPGITADIETVQWTKVKNLDEYKPKLDIGSKDYLACLKYALATNLYIGKQKDKAYYVTKKIYGFDVAPKPKQRLLSVPGKRAKPPKDTFNDW